MHHATIPMRFKQIYYSLRAVAELGHRSASSELAPGVAVENRGRLPSAGGLDFDDRGLGGGERLRPSDP